MSGSGDEGGRGEEGLQASEMENPSPFVCLRRPRGEEDGTGDGGKEGIGGGLGDLDTCLRAWNSFLFFLRFLCSSTFQHLKYLSRNLWMVRVYIFWEIFGE